MCVSCKGGCVWCVLLIVDGGGGGVGNIVDACSRASLIVLGACLYIF